MQVELAMTNLWRPVGLSHYCKKTFSLKLVVSCGEKVKVDKLLWIIILIMFGLKSNWRFTSGVTNRHGFSFSFPPFSFFFFFFWEGGSRRSLSTNGRKAEARMDLIPKMCHGHLMEKNSSGCIICVFHSCPDHKKKKKKNTRRNENWIHFLGVGLSKPLRGYSGYPAEAGTQRGGGRGANSTSLVTPTCHIPPLLSLFPPFLMH